MDLNPCSTIRIEFAHSASPTFSKALDVARKFAGFSEAGSAKTKTYSVGVPWEEWEEAIELVEYLKGWRNRWVYVDGEKSDWSAVLHFLHCFNARKSAYNPEYHCVEGEYKTDIHPFGCVFSGLSLVWPSTGWLQAGNFDREIVFHFDKQEMRKILEESLFKVRFCPALDLRRAEEVLRVFPDNANPRRDKRWEYDTAQWSRAPLRKGVPVTIHHSGSWIEKREAYGVRAVSRQGAISILAEIAAKLRDSHLPLISEQA
jgi:hypothetical protein